MIRITIEMVPGGDDSRARVLAQGIIVNDGTGTAHKGNYRYGFTKQVPKSGRDPGIGREGSVTNFPRKSADVWELLRRCL